MPLTGQAIGSHLGSLIPSVLKEIVIAAVSVAMYYSSTL